ncbi:MAG TPA: hypothetical protein VJH03_09335 [Blastocatellia bacterium]|nr:hypothetical protein [Blastocatellia bacterium]
MPTSRQCQFCNNPRPRAASVCPHCGRPGLYPNVEEAEDRDERAALTRRYEAALVGSTTRGADGALKDFEAAAANSSAVLARSPGELLRLASSDLELYATFYQLIEGGVRLSSGDEWDFRRQVADLTLFPGYFKQIRFAALSLDGFGLRTFGSCSITLRADMIAHRTSVLEENSVLFVERHGAASKKGAVPQGYRATWNDRGRLCAAKLHKAVDSDTGPDKYSSLLMRQGATSEEHEFVEAHIFGPMTIRTIEQVTVSKRRKRADNISIKRIEEELKKFGVTLRVA